MTNNLQKQLKCKMLTRENIGEFSDQPSSCQSFSSQIMCRAILPMPTFALDSMSLENLYECSIICLIILCYSNVARTLDNLRSNKTTLTGANDSIIDCSATSPTQDTNYHITLRIRYKGRVHRYRTLTVCVHVYVCMIYVGMFVCTYVHMCVPVYVCMYVCTYVYMFAHMYVRVYVCMYVCMYVRMYVCMYVCMCVCTYVHIYVCMYVGMLCVHICVCNYVCHLDKIMSPKNSLFTAKISKQ